MALAAGACSTSTTAMLVLEEVARLRPGERVLMHAAAGGIGSQLGQAARLGGAGRVVGASAARPAEAALAFGYDQVVVRDELDGDAGFDVVVDPVGGPARWASLDALALGGRLVVMGTASGAPDVAFGANELWLASKGVLGFNLAAFSATHPDRAGQALRGAVDAVLAGQLHVELRDRCPRRDRRRARRIESGRSTGKLVLDLSPERRVEVGTEDLLGLDWPRRMSCSRSCLRIASMRACARKCRRR